MTGLGGLVYGLIDGGAHGFNQPSAITALAVGVLGLVRFVIAEARGRRPMMPLTLFTTTLLRIALLGGFAFLAAWFATVFLGSLNLQQQLGLPPLLAGLAFLPSALVSVVGNLASGPLTNRYGTRALVVAGLGSITIGLFLLAVTAPLGSPWLTSLLIIPVGAGGSIAMPPTTGLVLAAAPASLAGTASAVFNTGRQVGGAIAIAVFGALVADRTQFLAGMQTSLITAASLVLAAVLAATRIRPATTTLPKEQQP